MACSKFSFNSDVVLDFVPRFILLRAIKYVENWYSRNAELKYQLGKHFPIFPLNIYFYRK